jgi:hypothetical protein
MPYISCDTTRTKSRPPAEQIYTSNPLACSRVMSSRIGRKAILV